MWLPAEERALLHAIGRQVRLVRRTARRTRKDLAAAAGVPVELVRLVESGDPTPPLLVVRRLVRAPGLRDWLVTISMAERQHERRS
jgi:predicted transcriptional regulator